MTSIIDAIKKAPSNTFVIFYTMDCGYSMRALEYMEKNNISYIKKNIYAIKFKSKNAQKQYPSDANMNLLLQVFTKNKLQLNYNILHKTRPIIFYNGLFIGGYDDLINFVNENRLR